MVRKVVMVMVMVSLLVVASSVCAGVYRWSEVTVDQAAWIVRDFARDPNLELTYKGVDDTTDIWVAPWMFGLAVDHVFKSGHREHCVGVWDPNGVDFIDASDIMDPEGYYGEPFDEAALHARQMPVEDARPLADAALAAHHPDAGLLTMVGVDDFPTTGHEDSVFAAYYRFYYHRILDNGAIATSAAAVAIDSVFGTLVGYTQIAYPVLVDWHPILDERDAVDAAAAALFYGPASDPVVDELQVTPPDELGLERLIWNVTLTGYENTDEAPDWVRFHARVDAHTGQVVHFSELTCIAPPSATRQEPQPASKPPYQPPLQLLRGQAPVAATYPPVVMCDNVYLYLLNLPGLGAEVEVLGTGRAEVTGPERSGYVDAKRGILTLNGRPFLRYGKPVIIKGRTYVPLDFARRLLDVSVTVRRAPPYA